MCKYFSEGENMYKGGLKRYYDDIISTIDYFFDKWDPSPATQMEEVCGPQGGLC